MEEGREGEEQEGSSLQCKGGKTSAASSADAHVTFAGASPFQVLELLGLDGGAGDRCLGLFHVGRALPARAAAYRVSRQPWQEKVRWLGGKGE